MNKTILVHGYNKDKNVMLKLKTNLEEYDYDVILADLPLTFEKIEHCIDLFKKMTNKIIDNLEDHEKIKKLNQEILLFYLLINMKNHFLM